MYRRKSLWMIICSICMIHFLLVVLFLQPIITHYRSQLDNCGITRIRDSARALFGNLAPAFAGDQFNNMGNSRAPYVNPHDFPYIINNPSLCTGLDRLDYLIYVHSAPGNFIRRDILRKTWAQNNLFPDKISRVVFFLANPMNETIQRGVYNDSRLHGDIIQEDYIDSYKNLTYKGISALKWVTLNCNIAKYVFKTDDDSFVDMFFMFRVIKETLAGQCRFLSGMVYYEGTMPILRDPESCSKWCVEPEIFPGKTHYPPYMSGGFFILPGAIVSEMYNASLHEPFIWIDDVYITGLLPSHLADFRYIDHTEYHMNNKTRFTEQYQANNTIYWFESQVPHDGERAALWQACLERQLPEHIKQQLGYARYDELVRAASETTSLFNPS